MNLQKRKAHRNRPLTSEESQFATTHLNLVWWYLHRRQLPADEWFDIIVLRYLNSVKRWFTEPELHKWKFTTIAIAAMRSAIGNEVKKQMRRPQSVSIYSIIPETNNLSFAQTLTDHII